MGNAIYLLEMGLKLRRGRPGNYCFLLHIIYMFLFFKDIIKALYIFKYIFLRQSVTLHSKAGLELTV